MSRALQLAKRGLYTTDPNPRVGCVVVKNEKLVGEGWHQRAGQHHAEVIAIQEAGSSAEGATAYVTLEPCSHFGKTPPCAQALVKAGVNRVVIAMQDPNPLVSGSGIAQLGEADVLVSTGLHEQEAELLNKGFCKRMRSGLPWIMSKLAVSIDGRTSLLNGDSKWITGSAARQDVHSLRARSSALMSATGTVLADNPQLTARLDNVSTEIIQPIRVILDSSLNLDPDRKVFNLPGRVILFTLNTDLAKHQPFIDRKITVCVTQSDEKGRVDLSAVFLQLADFEINEVMIEAGPTLNGRLLELGLVDEWIVYQAGVVLGDQAHGMFNLPTMQTVRQGPRMKLEDVRKVGEDLRLHYSQIKE